MVSLNYLLVSVDCRPLEQLNNSTKGLVCCVMGFAWISKVPVVFFFFNLKRVPVVCSIKLNTSQQGSAKKFSLLFFSSDYSYSQF